MGNKYDVENITGHQFMDKEEKEFFETYSSALEEQEKLIAEQHEAEENSEEIDSLLKYMEAYEDEYVVKGALLKCTNGISQKRTLKYQNESIESVPVLIEENSRLQINEKRKETINGLIPANIEDSKGGIREEGNQKINIISFGNCCKIRNGAELEQLVADPAKREKIKEAIEAGKGTCYCFMQLNDEWDNLAMAGEFMTGVFLYPCAGIEKALLSPSYMKFNKKEGINMMSMLFCKYGGGIITAQESGQIDSTKPDDELYEYMLSMLISINSIDKSFDKAVNDFKSAYVKNKEKYKDLAELTGVPPELLAVIHYRENTSDYLSGAFNVYLHNGDPLGKPTTHFPENKLFDNFQDAAKDAMQSQQRNIDKYHLTSDSKDMVAILCFAETYNGLGYYKGGHVSPYVFSGTNVYVSGKYVEEMDENNKNKSVYKPEAVDKQVGAYLLLNSIIYE